MGGQIYTSLVIYPFSGGNGTNFPKRPVPVFWPLGTTKQRQAMGHFHGCRSYFQSEHLHSARFIVRTFARCHEIWENLVSVQCNWLHDSLLKIRLGLA